MIEFWNPVPIFYEDCDLLGLGIIDEIKLKEEKIERFYVFDSWGDNVSATAFSCKNILAVVEMPKLQKLLFEKTLQFLHELKLFPSNIEISHSWFNKIHKTGFQNTHEHGNSTISGCLYYDYDNKEKENGLDFILDNPIRDFRTKDSISYEYIPGRLILFPGTTLHKVNYKKTEGVRKSFSFNAHARF